MNYKAKSLILGRTGKRDEQGRGPVFVRLFGVNDPHKTTEAPLNFLDFEKVQKIVLKGMDVNYLIGGSDIYANDLEEVDITEEKDKNNIIIVGKQKK
ncbi:hypothetical protein JXB27_03895 [Candidatus Woesearchaeota archaeon]|nr:hypothetical protein [Candidatus Woesearchaeota archaeon]